MRGIWEFLLLLIFGPVILLIGIRVLLELLLVLLPWILLLALITGVVAGLSAGFVLRRRLPPLRPGRPLPPEEALGQQPVRRPRGPGRRQE